MKVSGFDRALRYFFYQSQLYVICTISGSLAMTLYIWLINGSVEIFNDLLTVIPGTMTYVSMIVLFTIAATAGQYWYPMLISFGCRRKNVFWGHLFMVFLFMTEIFAIDKISEKLLHTDVLSLDTWTLLALYLFIEGISTLMNIFTIKWGRRSQVLVIVVILAISMGYGFFMAFSESSISISAIPFLGRLAASWQWMRLLSGAAFCLAANAANYRILSRYEIKA